MKQGRGSCGAEVADFFDVCGLFFSAPDPMQSVNPSHLPGTPETEEPPAVNGSDSNGKPKIGCVSALSGCGPGREQPI